MKKHGDTEARRKKDEGGRMMDEKEETSITVSSFITHPSYFPVLSVFSFFFISIKVIFAIIF
jgi:hypothetical protein